MSHYAKIVEPLVIELPGRQTLRLGVGTEVKNILIVDGSFSFDAKLGRDWCPLLTDADLPAFTDKGREGRAKHPRTTMQRGRPTKSNAPLTTTTGVRMRRDQLAALDAGCLKADVTRNEAIVGALVLAGLVPQ